MKIHLVRTSLPLLAGAEQTAECGKKIANAIFPFIWDLDYENAATLNATRICARCYARRGQGMYLYGLVNGQEARHSEDL